MREHKPTNRSIAFTSIMLLEDSEKSLTLIHVFLQIRQTYWCLCLIDNGYKSLQLMDGTEKPHTQTNTSRLWMTGIMMPAVRLHHFQSGTWLLLRRVHISSSFFYRYLISWCFINWIHHHFQVRTGTGRTEAYSVGPPGQASPRMRGDEQGGRTE
jgi:hypothetical protein